jgi:hypothetical protein
VIEAQGISEPRMCDGETLVVNLHGALILTAVPLRVRMEFRFNVRATDKLAAAEVVYVDPDPQTHHDTAESNWRDLTTFGDCHCHQMIGMTGDASLDSVSPPLR